VIARARGRGVNGKKRRGIGGGEGREIHTNIVDDGQLNRRPVPNAVRRPRLGLFELLFTVHQSLLVRRHAYLFFNLNLAHKHFVQWQHLHASYFLASPVHNEEVNRRRRLLNVEEHTGQRPLRLDM